MATGELRPGAAARGLIPHLLLALLVVVSFAQVRGHGFVGYDDLDYVVENRHVNSGLTLANLRWALTSTEHANWHPLTWLSHMLDAECFGLRPAGHHLTNLLFHLLNTALLFRILLRLTGAAGPSLFVAALFGVHPLHVESVAWVSERKDVLSTFLWCLTVSAYGAYVRHPRRRTMGAVALLFAAALAAKPMVITLPFLLLLLDYWPLGRIPPASSAPGALRRAVVEKTPLFALVLASLVVTFQAQSRGGMVKPAELYPLAARLGNALLSYAAYLGKALYPTGLVIPYAFDVGPFPLGKGLGAFALLSLATAAALSARRRWPYLTVGWLWYLGTLVPVIGLVQLADQSRADRYTYVPLVGLFLCAAWGARDLAGRRGGVPARALLPAAALVVSACVVATRAQVGHWRDLESLVSHALAVAPENWLAQNNMGILRESQGRVDEAVAHYEEALRLNPRFSHPSYHLGRVMLSRGNLEEAVRYYRRTLEVNPGYDEAYSDLGVILTRRGRREEAIAMFEQALRLDPASAPAHNNLGYVYLELSRLDAAIRHFEEAVRLDPAFPRALHNLATALARQGRGPEAARYRRAARELETRGEGPAGRSAGAAPRPRP